MNILNGFLKDATEGLVTKAIDKQLQRFAGSVAFYLVQSFFINDLNCTVHQWYLVSIDSKCITEGEV